MVRADRAGYFNGLGARMASASEHGLTAELHSALGAPNARRSRPAMLVEQIDGTPSTSKPHEATAILQHLAKWS